MENNLTKYIVPNIKREMNLRGVHMDDLAIHLRVSLATVYNRFHDPSTFRLCELMKICKKLNMQWDDLFKK